MKKKCQYSKCGKEFTPNKPRQQYCSDVHRVYANREKGVAKREPAPPKNALPKKQAIKKKPVATDVAPVAVAQANPTKPKNLEELKGLCPKELSGFDRSAWISTERQKYGI